MVTLGQDTCDERYCHIRKIERLHDLDVDVNNVTHLVVKTKRIGHIDEFEVFDFTSIVTVRLA
jgi:hypothetical protein